MEHKKIRIAAALMLAATLGSPHGAAAQKPPSPPLIIQEQGSFAVGGTVIRNPGTFDADQAGVRTARRFTATMRACSTRCR